MKKLFFFSLFLFNYTTFGKTKITTRVSKNIILQDSTLNKWISSFDLSYNHLCFSEKDYFKTPKDKLHYKSYDSKDDSEDNLEIYQKPNGKYILLNKITKSKIVNQEFDGLRKFGKNRILVGQGFYKNALAKPKGAKIAYYNDFGSTEYREGILNEKGEIVIPIEYTSIEEIYGFHTDNENYEPQMYKCEYRRQTLKKTQPDNPRTPIGYNYIEVTDVEHEILDAKGKLITSTINKNIDISFFVKNGKLYTIYQYDYEYLKPGVKFMGYKEINEFSICEFGESPKIKFPGKINVRYSNFIPNSDYRLGNYFQNINPLIVTVENTSGNQHTPYKLFDLGNLNFINGIPEFDKMEIINDKKILLKNKQNYSSIMTSDFKTILPYVPYSLSLFFTKNFIFYGNIFLIDYNKSTEGRGLFKLGSGVILKPIYLEINEISDRYCLIKNKDNTYNIFDVLNQKMCLYKNFDRVELVEDRTKERFELGYQIGDTWTGFVDCMFEGKIERIQLPK